MLTVFYAWRGGGMPISIMLRIMALLGNISKNLIRIPVDKMQFDSAND